MTAARSAPTGAGPTPGARPGAQQAGSWPAAGHVRVAVIGAGFGGLAVLHALRRAGLRDAVALERGATVGGTWRDNTYPGCGCDVPSHLYSFSWAPNPHWSRTYSPQPEILRYLEDVARRTGLDRQVVLGVEVREARWDDAAARWRLRTGRGDLTADVLVSACGPLTEPVLPDLPGLDTFPGPVMHTARWRHDVSLLGRRVAVVGTGASVVQVVPAIQPEVARLTVFQRTPAWVVPRLDRGVSRAEQALFARLPAAQRAVRGWQYAARESRVPGFTWRPGLLRALEPVARGHLARQVRDPQLRARLTPSYRFGCKRVLPSDHFYPALTRPNVELVASALAAVDGNRLVAADGTTRPADVLVLGTGFETSDLPIGHLVHGRDGRTLAGTWAADGRSALQAGAVAGFPNLFLVCGPNSGLGHNSQLYMIESQAAYVVDAVRAMTAARLAALEPTPQAQRRWAAEMERRLARTVWQTGGCSSWYQDPDGRNTTLWPGPTFSFRRRTRTVDLRDHDLRLLGPDVAAARAGSAR